MAALTPGPVPDQAPAQPPAGAPRLVVAIDFGTFASGYAFQWRSDYDADRLQIRCNTKWTASGYCTYKTPTCLLLNSNKTVVSFGYEAEKKFSELEMNGENPENWYLFKHFKMNLYKRENISDDTPIEDHFGKHLPLVDVLAMSIKLMKDHVIKYLADDGVPYPESETKWVITVPAIWSDPAKQVTRNAAEKAGIKATNLSIALEPECAAIYCSQLPRDQLQIEGDGGKLQYIAAPGSIVMVVDMGGGTVDITTVQIEAGGTMKQIFGSGGGDWGGMKVNEKFLAHLTDIVGQEVLSDWMNRNLMDEYELRMEFECRKREVKHKNEDGGNDRFVIKLPTTLKYIWEKKEGKSVTQILQHKDLAENVKFMAGRLSFSPDIIREFFKEAIDEILAYVEWAFKEKQNVGVPINCMVLIGGFAESNLVVKSIRDGLKDRGIPVVRPLNTEMAVLNGAVLFGQNEEIVTSRIMRHTYGVGMVMEFNPKCHKEEHKFTMNGNNMANHVFRRHVTKGQEVKLGEWISLKEYYPLDELPSAAIHIFTSVKTDPIHTTEDGCCCIGKVDFDFSNPTNGDAKKRSQAIELSMNFGGTELKLKVKDKTSGKTVTKSLKL